ncbi:hypothetical protein ABPG74_013278 [Tetrahymena malaccensis]
MKITIALILSVAALFATVYCQQQNFAQKEDDICSRQGFYSCRLSLGCYYDGATASCRKIQQKDQLSQEYDHCKNLGSYACSSSRGCTPDGNGGCRKISTQNSNGPLKTKSTPNPENGISNDDDHCSRIGFYACSSDRGCMINPYTGQCQKLSDQVKQANQTTDNQNTLKQSASDDICSRLGFYACNSDLGCWIDPYTGHCAKISHEVKALQDSYDHCQNLGFYACSSSRGCTIDGNGKCKKIQP